MQSESDSYTSLQFWAKLISGPAVVQPAPEWHFDRLAVQLAIWLIVMTACLIFVARLSCCISDCICGSSRYRARDIIRRRRRVAVDTAAAASHSTFGVISSALQTMKGVNIGKVCAVGIVLTVVSFAGVVIYTLTAPPESFREWVLINHLFLSLTSGRSRLSNLCVGALQYFVIPCLSAGCYYTRQLWTGKSANSTTLQTNATIATLSAIDSSRCPRALPPPLHVRQIEGSTTADNDEEDEGRLPLVRPFQLSLPSSAPPRDKSEMAAAGPIVLLGRSGSRYDDEDLVRPTEPSASNLARSIDRLLSRPARSYVRIEDA